MNWPDMSSTQLGRVGLEQFLFNQSLLLAMVPLNRSILSGRLNISYRFETAE